MSAVETTNLPEIMADVAEAAVKLAEARKVEVPDGTDPAKYGPLFDAARMANTIGVMTGQLSLFSLASEGLFAIGSSADDAELRKTLVGTAALLTFWLNEIDNRN